MDIYVGPLAWLHLQEHQAASDFEGLHSRSEGTPLSYYTSCASVVARPPMDTVPKLCPAPFLPPPTSSASGDLGDTSTVTPCVFEPPPASPSRVWRLASGGRRVSGKVVMAERSSGRLSMTKRSGFCSRTSAYLRKYLQAPRAAAVAGQAGSRGEGRGVSRTRGPSKQRRTSRG